MSYTTKSAKANPVLKLNFPLWIVAASFAIIFILAFTEKSNSPLSGIMMFIVIYRLILTFPFSEHLITKSDNINNVQHDFDLRLSQNHKEEDTIEDDPMDYYSRRKELELTLIRFEALRMQQIERREAAPYTGDLVDCMIEEEQLILYYPNGRIEHHFWCEFKYYVISDQTLFLYKSDRSPTLVLDKKKVGVFFEPIFSAVMDYVDHI